MINIFKKLKEFITKKPKFKLKITEINLYHELKKGFNYIKDKETVKRLCMKCISYNRISEIYYKALSCFPKRIIIPKTKNSNIVFELDKKPLAEYMLKNNKYKMPSGWHKMSKKLGRAARKIRNKMIKEITEEEQNKPKTFICKQCKKRFKRFVAKNNNIPLYCWECWDKNE